MKNERVLITGCGGMLGSAIYPYFAARYAHVLATDKDVTERWLLPLNVRDDARLERVFDEFRPNLVIHLAAETDVEYCEINSRIAEDTNSRATGTIADLSRKHGSTLIYVSSSSVFEGAKDRVYTEEDKPNPVMVYGRTKYEGEIKARRYGKSFIVRAGWIMGGGRQKEKTFVYRVLEQIAEGKREICAVDDLWGSPTYAHDFALNLFALIESEKYGTYHMAGEGYGTHLEVARQVLSICNRPDIALTPVSAEFFSDRYFVRRPASEMMANAGLRNIGCLYMRNWKVALREYVHNYFADCIRIPQAAAGKITQHLKTPPVQKRRRPREILSVPILYFFNEGAAPPRYLARAVDVSEDGLGIVTETHLQTGNVITIQQGGHHWRRAIVRWINGSDGTYRVGLKLLDAAGEMAHSEHGVDYARLTTVG